MPFPVGYSESQISRSATFLFKVEQAQHPRTGRVSFLYLKMVHRRKQQGNPGTVQDYHVLLIEAFFLDLSAKLLF